MGQTTYCFWDIRSVQDLIFVAIHLAISIVLMVFIFKSCCRSRKHFQSMTIFLMYIYLAVWSIGNYFYHVSYLAQYLYGIAIYIKFEGDFTNISAGQFAFYSTIFEFMDFTTAFVLLGCIFFISSRLYSRTLKASQRMGSPITNNQKKNKKILNFLSVFQIYLVHTSWQKNNQQNNQNYNLIICSSIQLFLYFVDFMICNVVLWHVISTMRQKNQELELADDQQSSKLRRQTRYLKAIVLLRLLFGFVFSLYNSIGNFFIDDDCRSDLLAVSITYLLIGQFIFHTIPVMVILYIFKIQKKHQSSEYRHIYKSLRDQP